MEQFLKECCLPFCLLACSVLCLYKQLLWLLWLIKRLKNEDPWFTSQNSAEMEFHPKKLLTFHKEKAVACAHMLVSGRRVIMFASSKRKVQKSSFFAKFDSWTGLEGESTLNTGKKGEIIRKKPRKFGGKFFFVHSQPPTLSYWVRGSLLCASFTPFHSIPEPWGTPRRAGPGLGHGLKDGTQELRVLLGSDA